MSLVDPLNTVFLSLPAHTVCSTESYHRSYFYIQSADVRCNDLSFSVHLYMDTHLSQHRLVWVYFTHASLKDIRRTWNPMERSISEIFIGHYFLVFHQLPPVLSYDQILTAMMCHVFKS